MITSPTWIGLFHSFQDRMIKDSIRICLGVGWGIAIAELWLEPFWLYKLTILLAIIIFLLVFRKFRHFQTSKRDILLCDNCIELKDDACPSYKAKFNAERQFSQELSDFLQKTLTWNDVKHTLPQEKSTENH